MPSQKTLQKAKRDLRRGKSPSTAAGEFVHEEIEHVRQGKHGARSPRQAIAIGLSKARRAGIPLPAPEKGTTSDSTRRAAQRELATARGKRKARPASPRRRRATERALEREPESTVSSAALSRQAKSAAARRHRRSSARPAQRRAA